jgi:hypothetical protein
MAKDHRRYVRARERRHVRVPVTFRPDWLDRPSAAPLVQVVQGLVAGMESDYGGRDVLSHAQRSLIRRAAHLEVIAASVESKMLGGSSVDADSYQWVVQCLVAVYGKLGLERQPAKPAQTLRDLMRSSSITPLRQEPAA